MRAHDGVHLRCECLLASLNVHRCLRVGPTKHSLRAIGPLCRVDRVQAVEHLLHAVGQRLIGKVLVCEYGVTAGVGHIVAVQHRCRGWRGLEAPVAMPRTAKQSALLVGFANHGKHIRMALDRCDERRVAEAAKLQRKRLELINRQALATKCQHHVLGKSGSDGFDGGGVEWRAHVDAMHISTETAGHWSQDKLHRC